MERYGVFGEEDASNLGRFGFTGQMRIPELGLAYFKNRFYDPATGRFLSPDPLGYVDGPNLYSYVLNDPVNNVDPWGLQAAPSDEDEEPIVVTGRRLRRRPLPLSFFPLRFPSFSTPQFDGGVNDGANQGGGNGDIGSEDPPKCPSVSPGKLGTTTERALASRRPFQAIVAYNLAQQSLRAAQNEFPRSPLHNDRGDAFRHFRWSFAMTQVLGAKTAAAFGDAHEVSVPNPPDETRMDLFNNAMGRAFALLPGYRRLSPTKAGLAALDAGCLMESVQ